MGNFLKKVCLLYMAGILMLCAFSCGKKHEHENVVTADQYGDATQEELPYGATIKQIKSGGSDDDKITVEFDHRFVTDEEAQKILSYMEALNTGNEELLKQTVYPDYLSYLCTNSDIADVKTYIQQITDRIKTNYTNGEDFKFGYIFINSCTTSDEDRQSFGQADTILEEIGGDELMAKITSRKMVQVDSMYNLTGSGESFSLASQAGQEQPFYLYTIDGEVFIV